MNSSAYDAYLNDSVLSVEVNLNSIVNLFEIYNTGVNVFSDIHVERFILNKPNVIELRYLAPNSVCWIPDNDYCDTVRVKRVSTTHLTGNVHFINCAVLCDTVIECVLGYFYNSFTYASNLQIVLDDTVQTNFTRYGYCTSGTTSTVYIYIRPHHSLVHFLSTLIHELSHFLCGCENGHNKHWLEMCTYVLALVKNNCHQIYDALEINVIELNRLSVCEIGICLDA